MGDGLMAAEQWAPVLDYEDSYEVSDFGRVRSVERVITKRTGVPMPIAARLLTARPDCDGYEWVFLSRDNRVASRRVHQLVLEAFVGPRPEGATQVRHLNGVSHANGLLNLAWGTQSENEHDKQRHGTATFAPQPTCKRNHLLIEPNLQVSGNGRRRCLACDRARGQVRDTSLYNRRVLDVDVQADLYYVQIMEGAA